MNIKRHLRMLLPLFCACAISASLASCHAQEDEKNLVGQKAVLTYPSLRAEVQYLSDKEIHWKTTDAEGHVAEETNSVSIHRISSHQFFLNWVESDGTQVTQVIDLSANKVQAYLTLPQADRATQKSDVQYLEGTVELQ